MTSLQTYLHYEKGGQWSNSFHFYPKVTHNHGIFNGKGHSMNVPICCGLTQTASMVVPMGLSK